MSFWAVGRDGNEMELEDLATIIHPQSKKRYIFYTDFDTDGKKRTKVCVAEILEEPDGAGFRLGAVQTDEEWTYLEEIFRLIAEIVVEDDKD